MERALREELLRRYVSGEMNIGEEHEFFIQVALDRELRHELKAQQEIDGAFAVDRSTPTFAEYSSIQSGVIAALPATAGSEPGTVASTGAASRSVFRIGTFTVSPLATSVVLAILAAVTIGLSLALDSDETSSRGTDGTPAPTPAYVMPENATVPEVRELPPDSDTRSDGLTSTAKPDRTETHSPEQNIRGTAIEGRSVSNRPVSDSLTRTQESGTTDKHGQTTESDNKDGGRLKVEAQVQWGDEGKR